MKQAFRHFVLMAPDGESSGGGGAVVETGKTFGTVSDAVAELDRREAERSKATKEKNLAKKAQEPAKAEPQDHEEPDEEQDQPDQRKKPEKAEKPEKAKTKEEPADDDEGEPDDEHEGDGDDEDAEPQERDPKSKRVAPEDEDGADDADDSLEEIEHEGKKHKVPKELKDAFLRHSDYTRKTQEVAEQRKQVDGAWREAGQLASQLAQSQQVLQQMAQMMIGQAPDLSLAQNDPQTYLVQKGLYEQRMQHMQQLFQQGHQLTEQQKHTQQRAQAEYLREQSQKMVEVMPELRSESARAQFRAQAIEIGVKYGFTPDDISAIADHRMLLVLRDLAKAQGVVSKATASAESVKKKLANVAPKTSKPLASGDANIRGRDDEAKRIFMKSSRTMKDVERWLKATER
jgi:hypothetical protein